MRGAGGRLAGDPCLVVQQMGRAGRAGSGRRRRICGKRRPARHLSGEPSGGAVRRGRSKRRCSTLQPLRARPAPLRGRRGDPAHRRRPGAVRRRRRGRRSPRSSGRLPAPRARRLVLDAAASAPPTRDIRSTAAARCGSSRATPDGSLGTVDAPPSHATVHTGAVYVHQGETLPGRRSSTSARVAPWSGAPTRTTRRWPATSPRSTVVETAARALVGRRAGCVRRSVQVTTQVVSYLAQGCHRRGRSERSRSTCRRATCSPRPSGGRSTDDRSSGPPDSPRATFPAPPMRPSTPRSACCRCSRPATAGTSAACRRRCTPTPACSTVFVYDGHPGGAGFAERGYQAPRDWLAATREAIAACECDDGCPSCVQSPKCGNGNNPLDKDAAVTLIDVLLKDASDVMEPDGEQVGSGARVKHQSPHPWGGAPTVRALP